MSSHQARPHRLDTWLELERAAARRFEWSEKLRYKNVVASDVELLSVRKSVDWVRANLRCVMELKVPVKRKKAKPPHSHPELVEELARELRAPRARAMKGIPDIQEEEQRYGGWLAVTVLWDRWAGVPMEERGPIILDAYRQARGEEEMLKITLPVGLTIEENLRLRARKRRDEADDV